MVTRMLIDAAHPEETRMVVIKGNRLEEFDFEASSKRQLKGNIYLAKVIRVEPSLQAAFVDYGGNRHGFLAFSEIHPDYYQIPVADRQTLIEREAAEERAQAVAEEAAETSAAEASEAAAAEEKSGRLDAPADDRPGETTVLPLVESIAPALSGGDDERAGERPVAESESPPIEALPQSGTAEAEGAPGQNGAEKAGDTGGDSETAAASSEEDGGPETSPAMTELTAVGGDDIDEVVVRRRRPTPRNYKIQEVIKRRQIMLVQVVKEERGNKGAALTTYLSLAGRYCVLMPNTARGGGISRKIVSAADRKRLKDIVEDLDVPGGMGVILRTAGIDRSKAEIKRDFEYLLRLWDNVRELTLKSTAPSPVYEEGNLIKRAIRDYYSNQIDEVLVEGDEGYRMAKDFMRLLMPSHAKKVQPYRERVHILQRFQVEQQFDSMYSPTVQLRSGGYLVINPTEALVSIDINSGKSTREHNIEETALKTNIEAAEEITRQLRLRDLAGLVVIDFIDMQDPRNNRAVERRMKECLKADRARIQVGHISPFGLLEMSRQRMRPSLLEASTQICPHCQGKGFIRSVQSTALHILRVIEEEAARERGVEITAAMDGVVAIYLLNYKRDAIRDIETQYQVSLVVEADNSLVPPEYRFERKKADIPTHEAVKPIHIESVVPETIEDAAEDAVEEVEATGEPRKRHRRHRRRAEGRAEVETQVEAPAAEKPAETEDTEQASPGGTADQPASGEESPRKRRRRGRRGGRRRRRAADNTSSDAETTSPPTDVNVAEETLATGLEEEAVVVRFPQTAADRLATRTPGDPGAPEPLVPMESEATPLSVVAEPGPHEKQPEPAPPAGEPTTATLMREAETSDVQKSASQSADEETKALPETADAEAVKAPSRPQRRGWWQRR